MNALGMWPAYARQQKPLRCTRPKSLHIDDLQTGDILLCKNAHSKSWFINLYEKLIRTVTKSPYSHVAMVVRDPPWVDQKGVYVLESAIESEPDAESAQPKIGVQTTKLSTLADGSCEIMIRRLVKGTISEQQLEEVHALTKDKMYDFFPIDLLSAVVHLDPNPRFQHTYAHICSSLSGFFMVKFAFLPSDFDWSVSLPKTYSSHSDSTTPWTDTVEYSKDTLLEIRK